MNHSSHCRMALYRPMVAGLVAFGCIAGGADNPTAWTDSRTTASPMVQVPSDATAEVTAQIATLSWGIPAFTVEEFNECPRPVWVQAACKSGGLWMTNDAWYGWQPGLGDWDPALSTNRLLIHIDRSLITSNLWLGVAASGETNATLLAGFYDSENTAVSDPVALRVAATTPWFTTTLNLSRMPTATILSLSASNGMMRIYCSALVGSQAIKSPSEGSPTIRKVDMVVQSRNPSLTAGASVTVEPTTDTRSNNPDSIDKDLPSRDPSDKASHPRTWHVNASLGDDDLYDGTTAVAGGPTAGGPKRTISAALANASLGDTVLVAAGTYVEQVRLDGIRMITQGRVVLQ